MGEWHNTNGIAMAITNENDNSTNLVGGWLRLESLPRKNEIPRLACLKDPFHKHPQNLHFTNAWLCLASVFLCLADESIQLHLPDEKKSLKLRNGP